LKPRGRVISLDPNPSRFTARGISTWHGRPLLVLEESERTTVSIRLDRVLGTLDQIVNVALQTRGIEAQVRYDERTIDVDVWGARVWYGSTYDAVDYGQSRYDGFELQIATSDGELRVVRTYVRAPNKQQDWRSRQTGTDRRVTDMRRQPAYTDGARVIPASAVNLGVSKPSKPYSITDFSNDFSEDFGE
jgi:hypothetical protein